MASGEVCRRAIIEHDVNAAGRKIVRVVLETRQSLPPREAPDC